MHIFTIVWQKGTQRLTFSPHKAARADTLVRPYIRVSLCFHEGLSGKITKNGLPPFTSSSISSSRAFFFFSSFFSIIVDFFIRRQPVPTIHFVKHSLLDSLSFSFILSFP